MSDDTTNEEFDAIVAGPLSDLSEAAEQEAEDARLDAIHERVDHIVDHLLTDFELIDAIKAELVERDWTDAGAETFALRAWERLMDRVDYAPISDEDEEDGE